MKILKIPLIRWAIIFSILVFSQHFVLKQLGWGPDTLQNLDVDTIFAALSVSKKQPTPFISDVEGQVIIPLEQYGSGWIISVELNGLYTAKLLVDTGATITSLSEDLAFDMGLTADPRYSRISAETANGTTTAWLTQVETIRSGEAELKNLQVAILDFSNLSKRNVHGLLGMNFLNNFEWRLDQQHEALILQLKT
ncbi:retropepsin-like aspartic protease family protein [Nitrospira sp. M1]